MPSYLDLIVIGVVFASGILALLRGFTREILAILSWVAAAAAAYYLHPLAMPYVKPYVPKETIALFVAAAVVFFATLVIVSLFTVKVSDLILDSKVGALDRTLGFVFGAARGLLLAVVAFAFYGWLVPETNQPEWIQSARTKPVLQASALKLRDYLPDDIDSLIAKVKTKKIGPAEEAPAESDADAAKAAPAEPDEAAPEKNSELQSEPADATYGANGASDQKKLGASSAPGKNAR